MTTYQIITTTRTGVDYGPEFAVEDAIANLIDNNLDYFIEKLLDEKPEQLINNINQKGTEND